MKIRLIKSQIHTKGPSHVRSLKCSQCKNVRQFLKLSVRASAREREWGRSGLERKKWEDGRVRQGHGDSKRSSMWRCGRVVKKTDAGEGKGSKWMIVVAVAGKTREDEGALRWREGEKRGVEEVEQCLCRAEGGGTGMKKEKKKLRRKGRKGSERE